MAHPLDEAGVELSILATRNGQRTPERIVSVPTAMQWFDRLTCNKSSVSFPDAYHELHHEPVRDRVRTFVRDWALGSPEGLGT